ncbi:MAG: UDP-N-acetylmuramoyl-L-alanyl-D-glutamate--2,6-diaminopimelate ligase [Armatimonadetes bacterium]|jgi:UDP-N-acetylmuramoyl-L-alanyl-D-glutamate--2,6-diaminopimelate ligase|nr:UDP-N-acetylmuramoyl-L-alanyl-D-glutamate--2,6-diaminopimelate ligase [Armatimonadota bacterium]MDI9602918.1 UDP-N-acetylmuramoyl-L-alanyl-D-glutamate--2,6-diaminopimelate ligase [Acidobacteriota bacterium]NLN91564.1 UDP-N-acetylmuramoyl-L-alanyl-D-glutamate--2,6-diaminopimelate ligase [candidate division WS1 bacterium]
MTLSQLSYHLEKHVLGSRGELERPLSGACHDSREVEPGDLYIALKGERWNGHDFLAEALARGASGALVEGVGNLSRVPPDMPALAVDHARSVMATVATLVYDRPAGSVDLLGVTGTNGKTSTCYFLDSIARAAGRASGLFTTLEIRDPSGRSLEAGRTTPEATVIQKWLRHMVDRGAQQVAMEVSSHAVDWGRIEGCEFAGLLFTNLTQDHLDWHGSIEAYFESKARLFTRALFKREDCVGGVNVDDPYGRQLLGRADCRVVTFAMDSPADVRAHDVRLSLHGTNMELEVNGDRSPVRLHLLGRFAAWNALAAATLAHARGESLDAIVRGLEDLRAVPGRLELVSRGSEPRVLVDYAHTPDSLRSVLQSVREFCPGRLLCVFGCGGDRDRTKRPLMGAAVAEGADVAYVTSDNPRSEDPEAILDMIAPGLAGAACTRIADRRAAIFEAIAEARPDDVVVIAGKGHETYQEARGQRVHFDDREVAREALDACRGGEPS